MYHTIASKEKVSIAFTKGSAASQSRWKKTASTWMRSTLLVESACVSERFSIRSLVVGDFKET